MATTHGPPPRPRRADAERSVAAIVHAARELLARGELPAMRAIAHAAGVGRVTLYAHFSSREEVLDAAVEYAMRETDDALRALDLDADPPSTALARLVRTSWRNLQGYGRLRAAALSGLGADRMRRHHDPVLRHTERLLDRGRETGEFRTDLGRAWLIAAFYAVLHAADDEVGAGRLAPEHGPDVLVTTVLSLMRPASD